MENYSENTDVVDYRNKSLDKLGIDIIKENKANLNEDLICDDDKLYMNMMACIYFTFHIDKINTSRRGKLAFKT